MLVLYCTYWGSEVYIEHSGALCSATLGVDRLTYVISGSLVTGNKARRQKVFDNNIIIKSIFGLNLVSYQAKKLGKQNSKQQSWRLSKVGHKVHVHIERGG